ncbi:MAG: 5-formyltetrahydrofolate cyclo-ligase [Gammaproteobacteria bacterium]|nr:5-formyltetrahydrofolate cyclo-ligase [Gammaproteobacteria bacterium]
MNESLKVQKKRLRERLRAKRDALTPEQRHQYSFAVQEKILALEEVRSAQNIFIYISTGTELNTHGLIEIFLQQAKRLAVPRILDRKTMVAVSMTGWEELREAELGILSPVSDNPLEVDFDITITPGLGFTPAGHRIGYGAGYYDRWFDRNHSGLRVAPAYETQVVEDFPTDEFDRPVHRIITEARVIDTDRR